MLFKVRIGIKSPFCSTIARLKKATLDFQLTVGFWRICSEPQNQGSLKSGPFLLLWRYGGSSQWM